MRLSEPALIGSERRFIIHQFLSCKTSTAVTASSLTYMFAATCTVFICLLSHARPTQINSCLHKLKASSSYGYTRLFCCADCPTVPHCQLNIHTHSRGQVDSRPHQRTFYSRLRHNGWRKCAKDGYGSEFWVVRDPPFCRRGQQFDHGLSQRAKKQAELAKAAGGGEPEYSHATSGGQVLI